MFFWMFLVINSTCVPFVRTGWSLLFFLSYVAVSPHCQDCCSPPSGPAHCSRRWHNQCRFCVRSMWGLSGSSPSGSFGAFAIWHLLPPIVRMMGVDVLCPLSSMDVHGVLVKLTLSGAFCVVISAEKNCTKLCSPIVQGQLPVLRGTTILGQQRIGNLRKLEKQVSTYNIDVISIMQLANSSFRCFSELPDPKPITHTSQLKRTTLKCFFSAIL